MKNRKKDIQDAIEVMIAGSIAGSILLAYLFTAGYLA
jgi:putative effector of murein hydrolase LrgA (UPF0299 family)